MKRKEDQKIKISILGNFQVQTCQAPLSSLLAGYGSGYRILSFSATSHAYSLQPMNCCVSHYDAKGLLWNSKQASD